MQMGNNEIIDKLDLWNFRKSNCEKGFFFQGSMDDYQLWATPSSAINAENWTKTSVSSNMLSRNGQNISCILIYTLNCQ